MLLVGVRVLKFGDITIEKNSSGQNLGIIKPETVQLVIAALTSVILTGVAIVVYVSHRVKSGRPWLFANLIIIAIFWITYFVQR
jgi:hypothetical protein